MKTYQIQYDPNENEGVYALSVVKSPAMESKFIALNKAKPVKLATISEERRILMGVALIPDKPIYRNDPEHGEFNIIFSKETIANAAYDFIRKGNSNNSTIEHTLDLGSDAVSVVESWIIEDDKQDKSRKYGFDEPVGSWVTMMKVHDDALWQMAKAGEIEGFSIDGIFNLNEIKMNKQKPQSKWDQFKALFADLDKTETETPKEVKLAQVKSADGEVTMEYEGETLEQGVSISIVSEDGNTSLPIGTYELEGGMTLVVEEEGIVGSVSEGQPEDEEVEMSDEDKSLEKLLDAIMGLKKDIETQAETIKTVKADLSKVMDKPASEGIKPKATKTTLNKDKAKLTLAERLELLNDKNK